VLREIVIGGWQGYGYIVYSKLLQCFICYNTFRYTLALKLLQAVTATPGTGIGIVVNNSGIMVQNNQEITGKRWWRGGAVRTERLLSRARPNLFHQLKHIKIMEQKNEILFDCDFNANNSIAHV